MPSNLLAYWHVCRRVYLVWAIVILVGFVATHFHQLPDINHLWLLLSVLGLGHMGFELKHLQFRDRTLITIGVLWLLMIGFGLIISAIVFKIEPLAELSTYLGIFWLGLMGLAHLFNGMVDRSNVYWLTGGVQIITGVLCFTVESLQPWQYLFAGFIWLMAQPSCCSLSLPIRVFPECKIFKH